MPRSETPHGGFLLGAASEPAPGSAGKPASPAQPRGRDTLQLALANIPQHYGGDRRKALCRGGLRQAWWRTVGMITGAAGWIHGLWKYKFGDSGGAGASRDILPWLPVLRSRSRRCSPRRCRGGGVCVDRLVMGPRHRGPRGPLLPFLQCVPNFPPARTAVGGRLLNPCRIDRGVERTRVAGNGDCVRVRGGSGSSCGNAQAVLSRCGVAADQSTPTGMVGREWSTMRER